MLKKFVTLSIVILVMNPGGVRIAYTESRAENQARFAEKIKASELKVGTGEAADLRKVFDPKRIAQTRYKLVLYNQDESGISNLSVLEREIARESYQTKPALRITETLTQGVSRTKTTVFVDLTTISPLYFEHSADGTVTKKAYFADGKEIILDISNGVEKKSELQIGASIFLSNSFSELLQANDFGKNPIVQFQTVSPGSTPNHYIAERFGEENIALSPNKPINCWIVRFTRLDPDGKKSVTGYRYIEKTSGHVLMFKSDLNSSKFFTYQVLLLSAAAPI